MSNQFDNYVLIGDTVSKEIEGYQFTAKLEFDDITSPEDFDCYDKEHIEAWKQDEWFYGGIMVAVSFCGIELTEHAVSLWGLDCNFPGSDNSYLNEVTQDLFQEALPIARQERASMIEKLQHCA